MLGGGQAGAHLWKRNRCSAEKLKRHSSPSENTEPEISYTNY